MPPPIICPSLLAADLADLTRDARRVLDAGGDWLHVDIMDGHFVPNITFGPSVVSSLRKGLAAGCGGARAAVLDCHLMVSAPAQWVDAFADAGADGFTFHVEAVPELADIRALVERITARGMRAGLAIRPSNADLVGFAETLRAVPGITLALVMTVEPGFGGQPFRDDQMEKVRALRAEFPALDIQVDGGLDSKTVATAAAAGANVIVAGTSVFRAPDAAAVIGTLRSAVRDAAGAAGVARVAGVAGVAGEALGAVATPSLKLFYFNIHGLAARIRIACAVGRIQLDDCRFSSRDEFTAMKASGELPFGQVPLLVVPQAGGAPPFRLAQSCAILKYVCTRAGLYPAHDALLSAAIDAQVASCADMMASYGAINYAARNGLAHLTEDALAAGFAAQRTDVVPRHLSFFEAALGRSTTGWVNGTAAPSCADFAWGTQLRDIRAGLNEPHLPRGVLDAFPRVLLFLDKFMQLAEVGEYYRVWG